jgi:hypothetical protein
MYLSTAALQVTLVDPLMLPLAAVIVDEPLTVAAALQVSRPVDVTVATLGTLEFQVTPVRVFAGPEEKLPVAVNCAVPPVGRVNCEGATVMESSTGAKQATVVDPVVMPVAVALVAEIVADPPTLALELQLTRPADTVAIFGALEAQVAEDVRFRVDSSV